MELKTLKDFKIIGNEDCCVNTYNYMVRNLKQEAIKWIKAIRDKKHIKFNYDGFCLVCQKHLGYVDNDNKISCKHKDNHSDKNWNKIIRDDCYECPGQIEDWIDCIKFMFNITEKDLK